MPINKTELDRIFREDQTILDKMENGKFYSFYEMSEMLLGEKIPEGTDKIVEYFSEGEERPKYEKMMVRLFLLAWKLARVESVLSTRIVRGDIIQGYKGNTPYFGKK